MITLADRERASEQPDKPRLGSFARPCPVRGVRLTECPYHTCSGSLRDHGHRLYECQGICGSWFELLPPETGFVYVGDLADDIDRSDASEWVM